jgi:hypothetical protein
MRNEDLDMVEARSKPPMMGIVVLGAAVTYALIGIALVIF